MFGAPGHSPYGSTSKSKAEPTKTTDIMRRSLPGWYFRINGQVVYTSSAYVPPESKTTVEPATSPSTS